MDDEREVRGANERFYRALEGYDLEAMAELWAHESWVACVHPGWEIVRGWESVEASWAAIFASSSRLRVSTDELEVRVVGDCAWVVCIEHIATRVAESFYRSRAQATNLYVKQAGHWRLVHHHASPMSESPLPDASSTVQ
jgi:uncharacterized protein (TIGR02246 family)